MAKTILVADDEQNVLLLLEEKLKSRGYQVLTARDGEQAVEKAFAQKPDLIILDVRMPRMDGDEAYMAIKANPATKPIPILILTGLRTDEEIAENREENMLAKPVNFELLFRKMKDLIGE